MSETNQTHAQPLPENQKDENNLIEQNETNESSVSHLEEFKQPDNNWAKEAPLNHDDHIQTTQNSHNFVNASQLQYMEESKEDKFEEIKTERTKNTIVANTLQAALFNKLLPHGYVIEEVENIIKNAQLREKASLAQTNQPSKPQKANKKLDKAQSLSKINQNEFEGFGNTLDKQLKEQCEDQNEEQPLMKSSTSEMIGKRYSARERKVLDYSNLVNGTGDFHNKLDYGEDTIPNRGKVKKPQNSEHQQHLKVPPQHYNKQLSPNQPVNPNLKARSQNSLQANIDLAKLKVTSDKEMSLQEKQQLRNNISMLAPEFQRGIILILSDCIQPNNAQTFEFELDSLPARKCRELDQYVKICLQQSQQKQKKKQSNQARKIDQKQKIQKQQKPKLEHKSEQQLSEPTNYAPQRYMTQDNNVYGGQQLLPQFNQFNNDINGLDPQNFNGTNDLYSNRGMPQNFEQQGPMQQLWQQIHQQQNINN